MPRARRSRCHRHPPRRSPTRQRPLGRGRTRCPAYGLRLGSLRAPRDRRRWWPRRLARRLPTTPRIRSSNGDYWLGYALRPIDLVTAPLRWETEDWIAGGLVAGLGVGLYLVEEDVRDWVQDHGSGAADRISLIIEPFGDRNLVASTIGAGYLAGFLMDDRKIEETALLALQGFVLTEIATFGLKKLVRRARPTSGRGHDAFDGPRWHGTGEPGRYQKSLPSGHAANAFVVATVVASEYDNPFVQAAAYGLATGVAWSRVYDDKHWATDVLAGAVLGYGIGKVVLEFSPFRDDGSLSISGSVSDSSGSLVLTSRF